MRELLKPAIEEATRKLSGHFELRPSVFRTLPIFLLVNAHPIDVHVLREVGEVVEFIFAFFV